MSAKNDLDASLQLEAVYYSSPIPRGLGVLVALGFVFDRIHFPGVYLPSGDYDRDAWKAEYDRIEELDKGRGHARELLAAMRFATVAERMEGFCCFDRQRDDRLDRQSDDRALVEAIYDEIWGPPNQNFVPTFIPWHHKGVPDSKEHLTYPGAFYYQAGAIQKAGKDGIALVNDLPGLPIPGIDGSVADDAKALAAFLAMQCMNVALPDLPLLSPDDLMEFRSENKDLLRGFRRAMLRYAGEWRGELKGLSPELIVKESRFLIETQIVPALDELRQLTSDPARPWHKRAIEGVKVAATITGSIVTMQFERAISQLIDALAPQFFTEMEAKGDKQHGLKRSDLYYLLKIQQTGR